MNAESFGWQDFDLTRVPLRADGWRECPIRDCQTPLQNSKVRKGERPFCPAHGLRLHSKTFVYFNGDDQKSAAALRNFNVLSDIAAAHFIESKSKAESYRLGYEMSEDAISWNVFVGLLESGGLKETTEWLIGKSITGEPQLYMWGERVHRDKQRVEPFMPLHEVRGRLEPNIQRFQTEPDVMLVVPGELLVCVEAKFGSGNTLAHGVTDRSGEKPTSKAGIVQRYLHGNTVRARHCIDGESAVRSRLHSQLFRNAVFAAEMAAQEDWHVVNLVSSTQWSHASGKPAANVSFEDPTAEFSVCLADGYKDRFHFRTWEDLYRSVVWDDSRLQRTAEYMHWKSAHFCPAFSL